MAQLSMIENNKKKITILRHNKMDRMGNHQEAKIIRCKVVRVINSKEDKEVRCKEVRCKAAKEIKDRVDKEIRCKADKEVKAIKVDKVIK